MWLQIPRPEDQGFVTSGGNKGFGRWQGFDIGDLTEMLSSCGNELCLLEEDTVVILQWILNHTSLIIVQLEKVATYQRLNGNINNKIYDASC